VNECLSDSCVFCFIPPAALLFGGMYLLCSFCDRMDNLANDNMERKTTTALNNGEWSTDERRENVSARMNGVNREQNDERETSNKYKELSVIVDLILILISLI